MGRFLFFSFFLFSIQLGFGQCPTTTTILSSQEDVDGFIVDYPNCTELERTIWVTGNDITNLDGLSNLVNIGVLMNSATFLIVDCPNLTDLSGLENLEHVYEFNLSNLGITNFSGLDNLMIVDNLNVQNNLSLINFEGLPSIEEIGVMNIIANEVLENFVGLEDLEILGGFFGQHQIGFNPSLSSLTGLHNLHTIVNEVIISECNQLQNLDVLQNLTHLGGLLIHDNDILDSIDGLMNVEPSSISNQIAIFDNPNLSECDLVFICENFANTSVSILIDNNAPGCNTNQEVMEDCEIVDIPDLNFLNLLLNYSPIIDTNADGNIQYTEAEAFTGNLDASNQNIQNFEGIEAFINISGFNGGNNQIADLDLSANASLASVVFGNNAQLENVNLKNGNNMAISNFQGLNCPNLQFICVDDIAYAEANFTNIDPQVTFVEDCSLLSTSGHDLVSFESYLMPNPTSGIFTVMLSEGNELKSVSVFSMTGAKVLETASASVDSSQWPSGVYFVQISSSEGTVTKKLIKK